MLDARAPGGVRGCRTGPDRVIVVRRPGPPPRKGTRPRRALGTLNVCPPVSHLCSPGRAMRFRKNPSSPGPGSLSLLLQRLLTVRPHARGIPTEADVSSAEGCAVFEDGWLSSCALSGHPPSPRCPSLSPTQATQRCPCPASQTCLAVCDPCPRRHSGPDALGWLWPLHLAQAHGSSI